MGLDGAHPVVEDGSCQVQIFTNESRCMQGTRGRALFTCYRHWCTAEILQPALDPKTQIQLHPVLDLRTLGCSFQGLGQAVVSTQYCMSDVTTRLPVCECLYIKIFVEDCDMFCLHMSRQYVPAVVFISSQSQGFRNELTILSFSEGEHKNILFDANNKHCNIKCGYYVCT